jgi:hypothetical protein
MRVVGEVSPYVHLGKLHETKKKANVPLDPWQALWRVCLGVHRTSPMGLYGRHTLSRSSMRFSALSMLTISSRSSWAEEFRMCKCNEATQAPELVLCMQGNVVAEHAGWLLYGLHKTSNLLLATLAVTAGHT